MSDGTEWCHVHARKEWNGWKMTCPWCKIDEQRKQLDAARNEIRRLMAAERIRERFRSEGEKEVEQMNQDLAEGKY